MRLLLLIALGASALGIGALAVFQRHLIYPGAFSGPHPGADRASPPGTSAVSIVTEDGERLYGLWRPPEPGCGVVLSFHGNASLPEWQAERFTAGPWRTSGWGVLAIAYRGYPGSTGSPSEDGLIADGIAAYRAVAKWAPGAPILLHGHSLGVAVAVAVAEREPHAGLYLEAPFDSLRRLVALRFPFLPTILLRDTYRSDLRIRKAGGPILIVHGLHDPVIPPKLAYGLAAAAPGSRLVVLEGDHVSILGHRDDEAEAMFRASGPRAAAASGSVR